jgi:2-polyprenyl-3-methyl-5-hydroxy-6-metoxy-1,4-benzoquinol methylase
MNRFRLADLLKSSKPVDKVAFIQNLCRDRVVLDLGCIRHNALVALADPNWIHKKIRDVAGKVIGIDYLKSEVGKIREYGYDVRCSDVTRPLELECTFDVIVAADLIEHLANFEAFFRNCSHLLKDDGFLVITTANPFYADEFRYVALKGGYLMNPEHTCWIDPYAMSLLTARYGFTVIDARFIQGGWRFPHVALEGKGHEYDILNDRWVNETRGQKILRHVVARILQPLSALSILRSDLVRYADYVMLMKKELKDTDGSETG